MLGARTSRPQRADRREVFAGEIKIIFALLAQCGRDVRAPSIMRLPNSETCRSTVSSSSLWINVIIYQPRSGQLHQLHARTSSLNKPVGPFCLAATVCRAAFRPANGFLTKQSANESTATAAHSRNQSEHRQSEYQRAAHKPVANKFGRRGR